MSLLPILLCTDFGTLVNRVAGPVSLQHVFAFLLNKQTQSAGGGEEGVFQGLKSGAWPQLQETADCFSTVAAHLHPQWW